MSADFTPEKEHLEILTPFKMQVLTNFPYIEADFDALTNYQLLCKVVENLNAVIAETNEVTEQTLSLYNAFVSLQNYVNTYLDVNMQAAINAKLDEMATDGTFANLMAQYVQTQAQLSFNTVAEMKLATNLVNGSFVKTYGYYTYNDGGGSLYKITDTESLSEYQEELANDLYATLVIGENIRPEQLGAYGDGVHDDSAAIQAAIDTNHNVYLDNNYLIASTITVYSNTRIECSTKARMTYTGNSTCIYGTACYYTQLENIRIDSSNRTGIAILLEQSRNCVITNPHLTNFSTGIKIDGKSTWSASNVIYNPFIYKFNIGIHLTADLGHQTNDTKVIGGYIIDEIREITDPEAESICILNDASCDTNIFIGTAVEDANIGFYNKSPVSSTPMSLIGCRGENLTTYILRNGANCRNLNTIACNFKYDNAKVSVNARWDQNLDGKNLAGSYLGGPDYASRIIKYYDSGKSERYLISIQSEGIILGPGNGVKQHVHIRGTNASQVPTTYIKAGGADGLVLPNNFVMKSTNKYWKVNIDDTGAISTEEYTLQDT